MLSDHARWIVAVLAVVFVMAGWSGPVQAQSLDQRIADYRRKAADQARRQKAQEAAARAKLVAKRRVVVENVNIQEAPLAGVLAWYRDTTGIPLVVNWRALEEVGVDRRQEITIQIKNIRAGRLLSLIMQLASANINEQQPGDALIYEVTPWYIRLMTKSQANRHPVTRIYNVIDLVMTIPDFEGPDFDLEKVLDQGMDQGSTSLFIEERTSPRSERELRERRGDALAQLIADSIEPTIWQRNGGEFCSIRYHRGMLIVRAPAYVQEQIGRPMALSE